MILLAEICKFFNSTPTDERWYYASDFAEYFGDVLSSGLLHKDNVPGLQVTVIPNSLKTKVDVGQALIKGYSYKNTEPIELTHDITEVGLNRIDRIVLRLDLHNAVLSIKAFVKKGEEAVNPVPPTLQRDNYIYELSLAQVKITSNSTSISSTTLIDERMDEDLCGIVSSLISVPTSVFQQQWDYWFDITKGEHTQEMIDWLHQEQQIFADWRAGEESTFASWKEGQESDFENWSAVEKIVFDNWFNEMKNQLSTDAAGNLQSQIGQHLNAELPHKAKDSATGKTYLIGLGVEDGKPFIQYEEEV